MSRSRSAVRRVFSVLWLRPIDSMKTCLVLTLSAQTGRWQGWWVAYGQRAESHMPASGFVAFGVPASFRHSALAGSMNQQ